MQIFITILFIISFIINLLFIRFIYEYARNWPDLKKDFDEHMTEIYNKLNDPS